VKVGINDEGLFPYQPAKETKAKAEALGEPIPTMYIPRKPHPNGLLVYMVSSENNLQVNIN
jgi:hypothetical protein